MKLFIYNEDSWLDSEIIRTLNGIAWPILIGILCSDFHLKSFSGCEIVFTCIAIAIVTTAIWGYAMKRTVFFEWDARERQKKECFAVFYLFICITEVSLGSFAVLNMIHFCKEANVTNWEAYALFSLPILFVLFNLVNIPTLFEPLFDDSLSRGSIGKKPDGWDKEREELNIMDILNRDFR